MDVGIPATVYQWLIPTIEKLYSQYWVQILLKHTSKETAIMVSRTVPVDYCDLEEQNTIMLYRFKGSSIYLTADLMWRTMALYPHWESFGDESKSRHPKRANISERKRHIKINNMQPENRKHAQEAFDTTPTGSSAERNRQEVQ
jgi:hypothetical protein